VYTSVLDAYEDQIRQLPPEIQQAECCLIQIGRRHAQDFDAGHEPSGGGVQRVLKELRAIAESWTNPQTAQKPVSDLDAVRAKRNSRLSPTSDL
jgi:hypothetical protein